jgi:glucokinase
VLCGDIGGTHTRLALASVHAENVTLDQRRQYSNAESASFEEILQRYLADAATPNRACLAVAGPTDGHSARLTNLAWQFDTDALSRRFGFPFKLVNDFEAVAWGLDALSPDACRPLQSVPGEAHTPRLVLGPGTGLGVALSVWTGRGYRPVPGEGGHIGFAPANEEQVALLRFTQERYGRASIERILSGPGIADLYRFCRVASGDSATEERTPDEITRGALDGIDPMAAWAMRLFSRILGQTAGDLALAGGARGGVYIAGGIPPRILPLLEDGELLKGFRDKGRFKSWVETVPLTVVTDPDIGLKGAALAG